MNIYAGSLDVTYLVTIPRNRGPVRVKLAAGVQVLRAGTSTPMILGDLDIAALYSACPGVKLRPLVPTVKPEPVVVVEAPAAEPIVEQPKRRKKTEAATPEAEETAE